MVIMSKMKFNLYTFNWKVHFSNWFCLERINITIFATIDIEKDPNEPCECLRSKHTFEFHSTKWNEERGGGTNSTVTDIQSEQTTEPKRWRKWCEWWCSTRVGRRHWWWRSWDDRRHMQRSNAWGLRSLGWNSIVFAVEQQQQQWRWHFWTKRVSVWHCSTPIINKTRSC